MGLTRKGPQIAFGKQTITMADAGITSAKIDGIFKMTENGFLPWKGDGSIVNGITGIEIDGQYQFDGKDGVAGLDLTGIVALTLAEAGGVTNSATPQALTFTTYRDHIVNTGSVFTADPVDTTHNHSAADTLTLAAR